ncbi:hypothetical protein ACOTVZ_03035 [Aliarcobacter butzleri]
MSKNVIDLKGTSFEEDEFKGIKVDSEEIIDAEVITVPKIKLDKLGEAFTDLVKDITDDELSQKFANFIKAGRDLGMEAFDRTQLGRDLSVKETIELTSQAVGLVKDIGKLFLKDKVPETEQNTIKAEYIDTKNPLEHFKGFATPLKLEQNQKQLPFNGGTNGLAVENKNPIKPLNPNNEMKALESPKKAFKPTGKYSGKTKVKNDKDITR